MRTVIFLLLFVQVSLTYAQSAKHEHRCSRSAQGAPCFKNGETFRMKAANSRSDTLDVLHYDIHLTIANFASQTISGYTVVTFKPKISGITEALLDLQNMAVSNVTINELPTTYTYTSPLLRISLPQPVTTNDTLSVKVFYSGTPPTATFGGFYFTATYAYNMGVGIGVDPPNFGRAWFPCVDNFVERSTYSFNITTAANHKAFCGGMLQSVTNNPDGTRTWHWELSQTIPTYLASVAVSDYATVAYQHTGQERQIPVELGARASDTVNLKNSFIHLPNAISAFEHAWGPLQFSRVGFVVVPFNGGAMEHATNIAYPLFAVNGNLQWESLMAHELAHNWWGNLVTCQTASDMWINEGWASFNESLFSEYVYGKERYKTDIRTNHRDVLLYAHIRDGAFLPVSGVPFEATYGSHVYSKGASVAHTLRGYMGDSLFFHCTQNLLTDFAFRNLNSYQMSDYLSNCSGIDLSYFFNDWVFNPGFTHFSVDSTTVAVDEQGNYQSTVYIRQRLYNAPDFFRQVPLQITFLDFELNPHTYTIPVTGSCAAQTFTLPFYPVLTLVDLEEKLCDATIDRYEILENIGVADFADAGVSLNVAALTAPAFVRVTNNMVMPDRLETPITNIILHPNRYWTVDGFANGIFNASAEFTYNGAASTNGGYLDNNLISVAENNLRMLFRPNSGADWQIVSGATLLPGASNTDKRGSIRVNNLQFGEYALGIIDPARTDTLTTFLPDCITVGLPNQLLAETIRDKAFVAFPNPASGGVTIALTKPVAYSLQLQLINMEGKPVLQTNIAPHTAATFINTDNLVTGNYILQLTHPQTGAKLGEQQMHITGKR
ncbi:MAG TPA: M1 family aminopeptidase [Chitinophagales bacterium]|nr:M1 family aminopeptidase [Chitinophagales bacterium]HRK27209.1 M1 family aminopeptidase [Chitinophagales bacterium]